MRRKNRNRVIIKQQQIPEETLKQLSSYHKEDITTLPSKVKEFLSIFQTEDYFSLTNTFNKERSRGHIFEQIQALQTLLPMISQISSTIFEPEGKQTKEIIKINPPQTSYPIQNITSGFIYACNLLLTNKPTPFDNEQIINTLFNSTVSKAFIILDSEDFGNATKVIVSTCFQYLLGMFKDNIKEKIIIHSIKHYMDLPVNTDLSLTKALGKISYNDTKSNYNFYNLLVKIPVLLESLIVNSHIHLNKKIVDNIYTFYKNDYALQESVPVYIIHTLITFNYNLIFDHALEISTTQNREEFLLMLIDRNRKNDFYCKKKLLKILNTTNFNDEDKKFFRGILNNTLKKNDFTIKYIRKNKSIKKIIAKNNKIDSSLLSHGTEKLFNSYMLEQLLFQSNISLQETKTLIDNIINDNMINLNGQNLSYSAYLLIRDLVPILLYNDDYEFTEYIVTKLKEQNILEKNILDYKTLIQLQKYQSLCEQLPQLPINDLTPDQLVSTTISYSASILENVKEQIPMDVQMDDSQSNEEIVELFNSNSIDQNIENGYEAIQSKGVYLYKEIKECITYTFINNNFLPIREEIEERYIDFTYTNINSNFLPLYEEITETVHSNVIEQDIQDDYILSHITGIKHIYELSGQQTNYLQNLINALLENGSYKNDSYHLMCLTLAISITNNSEKFMEFYNQFSDEDKSMILNILGYDPYMQDTIYIYLKTVQKSLDILYKLDIKTSCYIGNQIHKGWNINGIDYLPDDTIYVGQFFNKTVHVYVYIPDYIKQEFANWDFIENKLREERGGNTIIRFIGPVLEVRPNNCDDRILCDIFTNNHFERLGVAKRVASHIELSAAIHKITIEHDKSKSHVPFASVS